MTRFLLPLLTAALAFSCSRAPARSPGDPVTCESDACRASLLLFSNGKPICGAVAIGPRLIVTAAHCVEGGGRPTLITLLAPTGRVITARIRVDNDSGDIAILESFSPLSAHVPIKAGALEPGFLVRPRRMWMTSETLISGPELLWRVMTPVDKGDSGSGVFAADGALVGVVSTCDSANGYSCTDSGGSYSPVAHPTASGDDIVIMTL